MSTLKPPPYKPRPKEGEEDREDKLTGEQLEGRERVMRAILVTMGVGAYAGLVLLVRELPGGGLPYVFPFSRIPSIVLWLAAIILGLAWSGQKSRILALLLALTFLAAASLLGSGFAYHADPQGWLHDLGLKFGR